MDSEINNRYYQKKENKYKYLDSNKHKNNIVYKSKADILPYNIKYYKQEPKVYIKLDPEYLENNYKNAENKYLKNQNDLYSPEKDDNKYNNYINTSENDNRKISSYNDDNNKENKTMSPIKKYIEKKNFNFYLNKGMKTKNQNQSDNYKNNVNEENYVNKSVDFNYSKNNRYIDNNNIDNDSIRSSQTQRKNLDSFNINIYQKKMIIIFIQIINKIIKKNKRRNILKIFLNILKKNNPNIEEKNNYNKKFKKKNTKYNEYKNIINNYVKTNNNNNESFNNKKNELINRMKNRNKESINQRNNNNNLKFQKTENDLKRLKELQKKYEQIYEKKKNSTNISNDYKYRNYILRKNKTQNTFTQNNLYKSTQNNYLNDITEILNEKMKAKLLKNKLIRNIKDSPQTSLRRKFNPYINNQKSQTFYTMPNLEESEETPSKRNNINDNKIIIKKLKITPKLGKNIKKDNIINKNEEIYKIYNIKDIETPDKRLYVFINYITLYNKKKYENNMNYYDNNLLKISNEINIDVYGINESKKKYRFNRYPIKKSKNLSKIEEESYSRGNDKSKNDNDIEKGILKLEKYKNKLKSETIKKNIINFKKEDKKVVKIPKKKY